MIWLIYMYIYIYPSYIYMSIDGYIFIYLYIYPSIYVKQSSAILWTPHDSRVVCLHASLTKVVKYELSRV